MSPPTADVASMPILTKQSEESQLEEVQKAQQASDNDLSAVAVPKDGIASFPAPPKFTDPYEERAYLKGRLVLAYRLFAKWGFDEGVAGHITIRDPVEPTSFWVNPFGVAWPLLQSKDLLLVNDKGDVVEGGEVKLLNKAAYMIHHAVHTARPEINCVAHSHSIYGRTFCALGINLDITTQDACAFYQDVALYNSFKGVVLAEEEGKNVAKALGGKKAALLQNHGLLTCAKTIEACIFWFSSLEKCCHTQLMADAAAAGRGIKTVKIDDEDAEFTKKAVGSEMAGWFSALPAFEMMKREVEEGYDQ